MSNQFVAPFGVFGGVFGVVAVLGAFACSGSAPARSETAKATAAAVDAGAAHAAQGDASAPSAAPSLESKDSKAVARTLTKVSELRGLRSLRPVPGVKLGRNELVAAVRDKALREYPPDALRHEGQVLELLGFAPPGFDYVGAMMKLLEEQLAGFYEPKDGTMYLAADLHGPEAQATLAHELVHALQDQHWDLRSRSLYRPGHSDESTATSCLAEGDATSLMIDFLLQHQGQTALALPDTLLAELAESNANMAEIKNVPHILRTSLFAPYVEGIAFVNALRRKGGWAAVDRAWERIPTTTEQILHIDKWEAGEGPLAVDTPTAQRLGPGWSKVDDDEFGELAFALMYEEWMPVADARQVASGWGGDRSSTWAKGDEIAFAVHVRYDAAPASGKNTDQGSLSEQAVRKIATALKKAFGKPALSDANHICFDRRNTGPLLFARKGNDLVMLAGPAKASPTEWSATGTCATSKAWATEILK
ncbi:MAG: hypothetical protein FWD73_09200 [Polyangiaceae bacterium]|nr:hypothetical protein [Polyangiaceae bacterium]